MFVHETKVTASSSAEVIRSVCCEQCQAEYVFKVNHSAESSTTYLYGIGGAEAKKRVKRAADKRVWAELQRLVRPVPCPACGWYQPEMVQEMRSRMPQPIDTGILILVAIGGGLLVLAFLGLVVTSDQPPDLDRQVNPYVTSGIMALVGLVALTTGFFQSRRRRSAMRVYSPNDVLPKDVRVARGKRKAILLAEYRKLCFEGNVVPYISAGH